MDLAYTEEQQLLADSLQKFVASQYPIGERNRLTATDPGFSREHWRQFAELGWLALPFPEEHYGLGGTVVDTMVLMEEFGKGLVVEPYLATVVLFGGGIDAAGSAEQKAHFIPKIADGSLMATFAWAEAAARYDLHHVGTRAVVDGDVYVINGTKSVVPNAATADAMLVAVRTGGHDRDEDGLSLVWLDPATPGIRREDYPTVDGLRASEVTFSDVRVPRDNLVGVEGAALPVIRKIATRAILALSAEAVGAMEVLYRDTIAYTRQREQFDHPLSDFQVLRHRMTEMFMEHSLAKSLCMKATMLEAEGSAETARTVNALKFLVGKAGRFIGQNAVQLHGGMGMTEELRVAHYFKRLMVIDAQFGNMDHHLTQFVAGAEHRTGGGNRVDSGGTRTR